MSTPAFVNSWSHSDFSPYTLSISPAAGNCLLVVCGNSPATHTAATTGASTTFTSLYSGWAGVASRHLDVLIAYGIPSGITGITFTDSGGNSVVAVVTEISGASAVDVQGTVSVVGFGSSETLNSITTSTPDLVLGIFAEANLPPGTVWTSPTNSFTLPTNSALQHNAVAYLSAPSPGTYQVGATAPQSDELTGFMLALSGSGGGGGGTATQRLGLVGVGS